MQINNALPDFEFFNGQIMKGINHTGILRRNIYLQIIQFVAYFFAGNVVWLQVWFIIGKHIQPYGIFNGSQIGSNILYRKELVIGSGFLLHRINNIGKAFIGQVAGGNNRTCDDNRQKCYLYFNP